MIYTIQQIWTALVAAIAIDHGDGFDLSGTGSVLKGQYKGPPAGLNRFAYVSSPAMRSRQGGGAPMGRFRREATLMVEAWGPTSNTSTATRAEEGLDIADRLMVALEAANQEKPTLTTDPIAPVYGIANFVVSAVNLDADLDPVPVGFARVFLEVSFTYIRSRGA